MLGLLAPPGAPATIAGRLAGDLPRELSERVSEHVEWDVRFLSEARAHEVDDDDVLLDVAQEKMEQEGWDYTVSITDLPLDVGRRPVVADASANHRVALLSLPALGATGRRRRAREAVVRLVRALAQGELGVEPEGPGTSRGAVRRIAQLVSPLRQVEPAEAESDLRLEASPVRGYLRLLIGMVAANRPWRVVLDLSRALAVALSTVAFTLVTNTIWQLAAALGAIRLSALTAISVAGMVAWLIVVHDLWRRPSDQVSGTQALMFNAATTITLLIGAITLYVILYTISLLATGLILDDSVLQNQIGHPVGFADYAYLAWFASSLATIGGTLGSGLEEHVDVREAAYGYNPDRHAEEEDPQESARRQGTDR